MEAHNLTYKLFGKQAILIEWPPEINENILNDIVEFKNRILASNNKVILEVINTYNSLTIFYTSTIDKIDSEILALKALYSQANKLVNTENRLWEIPVCYDVKFGIDLEEMALEKKVSNDQLIEWHSSAVYRVHFIGFLPGFLYLGGMDARLDTPRKSTPRLYVDKGSVGIGGSQTGVYPQNSAGGWNILGRSPISFFDSTKERPCFAKSGDHIKFRAIDLDAYMKIETQVKIGFYELKYRRND